MSSDEERLEEMLRAVMEAEEAAGSDQDEWNMEDQEDIPIPEIADLTDELPGDELPEAEIPEEKLPEAEISEEIIPEAEIPEEIMPEEKIPVEKKPEAPSEEEMMVDPLALLGMSEDEIDHILEQEIGADIQIPEEQEASGMGDVPEVPEEDEEFPGMQELFDLPEEEESTEASPENLQGSADSESQQQEASEKKPEKAKKKPEKKKKEKKKKEKKDGFGKKLASLFFGSDDEEETDDLTEMGGDAGEDGKEQKKETGKAAKNPKESKKKKEKKEKKKEPAKKKEADPKKAAKEKQKKEKNAEKAKKKAEKAEKAEKERRAERKLPKKKVFVWILFCASIGAGILLMNSVGMDTLNLTEARNAFDDKDFATAYQLMNGRILEEEDQLIFRQSSAILHLQHAKEAYENHLKLEKPVMALEDLLKGVAKYQELSRESADLLTSELTAEYQRILKILQEEYGLSEEGAAEINALESDYEFSLQLEALVNGEVYQSQEEIEQQQAQEAEKYADLEDILPEEEEYLNDSDN